LKSFVHNKSKFALCILAFCSTDGEQMRKYTDRGSHYMYSNEAFKVSRGTRKSELAFRKVIRNWIQRTHMILN